ncbi:MAG: cyanophycinase [Rudaea sp.]|nr:cyanophycinase [Rudaea sp.]
MFHHFGRLCALLIGIVAMAAAAAPEAATPPATHDYRDRNFDYFVTGDPALPRAAHTERGYALMGGGGTVDAAFRFIATHAGGGHIVILRAVSDDSYDPTDGDLGKSFQTQWGGVTSAETIVFHNREASSDPRVVAALRGADGIFLAGGDQANYLRYWKDTPVSDALNAHVRANRPIGGSSAGLAILGGHSYTAFDGGSMESRVAIADPFNSGMTLESDFLHCPYLEDVITDTHFSARSRLGRLIAFVARLHGDASGAKVFGIGIDEKTALLVGTDGVGHVAEGSAGSVWLVMPQQAGKVLARGKPLSISNLRLVRLGSAGSIDLKTRTIDHPAAEANLSIARGKLAGQSIASPIFQRSAVPGNES